MAQDGGFTWHSEPWRSLEELVRQRFVKPALDIEDFTAQASTRASVQRHRKNKFSRSFQRAIGDMLVRLHQEQ
jgi:hypothetical protein